MIKKLILLTVVCGLLTSCASTPELPADATLPQIYSAAYDEFNNENYDIAAPIFLAAETQNPASVWAADALIMAAYSQYLDGDFAGALLAADRFMRFHPGHADVPYVMYLRGMCYYRQVSDVRREPGMSVNALQQFQTLRQRFPKSEYAANAQNKIAILKNYIAGKVMYSARNDMAAQNWPAAITRLQSVVTDADDTVMTREALFRLAEAYTAIGLPDQARGFRDMLKLNFPDNEWTRRLSPPKMMG